MAGATLDNSLNVLQIHYGTRLNVQTNDRTNIWNMIPVHPERHTGKFRQENLTTGYPATGGARGPSATLPTAGSTSDALTNIYHSYQYHPISIDWDAYHQTDGKASFVNVMTREMDRVKRYMRIDLERQLLGDGSGKLAVIASPTVSGATWTFEVPNLELPGFVRDQRIVFVSASSGEVSKSSTLRGVPAGQNPFYTIIDADDDAGGTADHGLVTVSGQAPSGHGIIAGDIAVKEGSILFGAANAGTHAGTEIMGLRGIISDGAPPLLTATKATYPANDTFQAIDPTGNSLWKSPKIDAGGGDLDQTVFDSLAAKMVRLSATPPEEIKMWVCNQIQETIYKRSLYGAERYPVTSTNPSLPTGTADAMKDKQYLRFAGRPLVCSRYCKPEDVYGVGPDLYRYECQPWGFHKPGMGSGGSMWHQDFNRRAADQAEAYAILQFGTTARNGHGLITNLSRS